MYPETRDVLIGLCQSVVTGDQCVSVGSTCGHHTPYVASVGLVVVVYGNGSLLLASCAFSITDIKSL